MHSAIARHAAIPLFAGMLLAPPSALPAVPVPEAPTITVPAEYWGRIDRVWTEFDVWREGYKGMMVHMQFRTNGLLNSPCKAIAYFAYSDGEMLEDYNGVYTTRNGQVSASVDFTPRYENATFNDLQIFVPYSELHMASGRHSLRYHVELYSMWHGSHFAESQFVSFSFNTP
jgi:hypothetical protein